MLPFILENNMSQKINIGKMGLCATPESVQVIQDWIESHPENEQAALWTVMGMTWNFLAEFVDKAQEFGGDSYEHLEAEDE